MFARSHYSYLSEAKLMCQGMPTGDPKAFMGCVVTCRRGRPIAGSDLCGPVLLVPSHRALAASTGCVVTSRRGKPFDGSDLCGPVLTLLGSLSNNVFKHPSSYGVRSLVSRRGALKLVTRALRLGARAEKDKCS